MSKKQEGVNVSAINEKLLIGVIALVLCIVCLAISQWILPENCLIYEYRQIGLLCDGMDFSNPDPYPVCRDERLARVARIFFVAGWAVLLLPVFIVGIRRWRRTSPTATNL